MLRTRDHPTKSSGTVAIGFASPPTNYVSLQLGVQMHRHWDRFETDVLPVCIATHLAAITTQHTESG